MYKKSSPCRSLVIPVVGSPPKGYTKCQCSWCSFAFGSSRNQFSEASEDTAAATNASAVTVACAIAAASAVASASLVAAVSAMSAAWAAASASVGAVEEAAAVTSVVTVASAIAAVVCKRVGAVLLGSTRCGARFSSGLIL